MIFSPSNPASGLAPLSTLIPGMMPWAREHLGERGAVDVALADGLVEQDHAADELAHPVGGEQQLAVGAAVLLGRLDAMDLNRFSIVPELLVRREDALAGRHRSHGRAAESSVLIVAPSEVRCRSGAR